MQLNLHQVVELLIVRDFADQPSGRISRKRYLEADELVSLLAYNLRNWSNVRIQTAVTDGRFAHYIVLTGISPDGKSVRYLDPWPGASLLCADQNAAGVNALPDPQHPGGWIVDLRSLTRVLVAVQLPEACRQFWQSQFTDQRKSGTPFDPLARWDGWRPSRVDSTVASSIAALSTNPGSRQALASAALALSVAVRERDLKEEALHWLRQAAYAGNMLAAEALQKRCVAYSDQQHNDPTEWLQTVTRQAVLSGDIKIGKTFANLPEPSRNYWQRRQGQLEADYWERQVALVPEMKNPWAIETDMSHEQGDSSSAQYQMVEPIKGNDLDLARRLLAQGDLAGARRSYEQVVSTGHPVAAPTAAYELGDATLKSGDSAGAADLFRIATLSCDLVIGPWAACMLGLALEGLNEIEEAVAAYERAIYSGHRDASLASQINIGHLYCKRRMLFQAVDAYMQAAASDHSTYSPIGYLYAGLVYHDVKDMNRAKAFFEQVLRFPESQYTGYARDLLSKLEPGSRATG
jgi:tetratricopeptide (TPR) repeat protein